MAAIQVRLDASEEMRPHLQGLDRRGQLRHDGGVDPALGAHARRLAGRKEAVTVVQHSGSAHMRGSCVGWLCHETGDSTCWFPRAGSL